jgi:hypothetical protein
MLNTVVNKVKLHFTDVVFYTTRIILTDNKMAVGLYGDMGYRRKRCSYATLVTLTKPDNFTPVLCFCTTFLYKCNINCCYKS